MKKWTVIPILMLSVVFLSWQRQNKGLSDSEKPQANPAEQISSLAQEVENRLESAIENFQKGNVAGAAGLLLDTILLVKPSGDWPGGFEKAVSMAKEQFQAGDFEKGVASVTEALSLIQPSQNLEQGQKTDAPSPLAEVVKAEVLSAREEFKKGNAANGVILILRALQLLGPQTR